MGNLSDESRGQNRQDKVTRFRSVTYARLLGILANTLGSHLKLDGLPICKRKSYLKLSKLILNWTVRKN